MYLCLAANTSLKNWFGSDCFCLVTNISLRNDLCLTIFMLGNKHHPWKLIWVRLYLCLASNISLGLTVFMLGNKHQSWKFIWVWLYLCLATNISLGLTIFMLGNKHQLGPDCIYAWQQTPVLKIYLGLTIFLIGNKYQPWKYLFGSDYIYTLENWFDLFFHLWPYHDVLFDFFFISIISLFAITEVTKIIWASLRQNLSSGFPTKPD